MYIRCRECVTKDNQNGDLGVKKQKMNLEYVVTWEGGRGREERERELLLYLYNNTI